VAQSGVEELTRQNIRREIGKNLMGDDFVISATTTAGNDTSSLIDNTLFGGPSRYNGWHIIVASGETNGGETSRVTKMEENTPATDDRDLTLRPALTTTIPTGMDYELWDTQYPPVRVNDAINRAISAVLKLFYVPQTSFALHGDGKTARFDLPTEFDMVNRVEYRKNIDNLELHACDRVFDESVDADFTVTIDTEIRKRGNSSVKFVIAGTVSNADFASDSIGSIDISRMTHIEMWVRCITAVAASDLAFSLDDTANLTSPLETITLPAVTADTWTFVRLALTAPESLTAIISLALEYNANAGANTIWLDDIRAVDENSATWVTLKDHLWGIDKENDDLILPVSGVQTAGYRLLKITGGQHPAQMTGDTDTATVPETYLIAKATSLMLSGGSRAVGDDAAGRRSLAAAWEREALIERGKFDTLQGVRTV